MRTACSASWLSTLGVTRRRARKKPRSTADTAIQGMPSAEACSAPAARTSPSHHFAARPAVASCAAAAANPSASPAASKRRSIPRALPLCSGVLSSSAMSRVAATDTPAVASVTNSEYTARTS